MLVFRIYNDGRLPNDAMGAKIAGGRWNPRGYLVLYAATHLSLACLEKIVHLERGTMPLKLRYAWTELPDDLDSLDPRKQHIGKGIGTTSDMGMQWLVHGDELAIRVPSVLIPEEDNVLINPVHQDYEGLHWESLPFEWDARLVELVSGARPGE